ncbi:hypothetical protein [Rhizobium indigoferae]|uniref:HTH merR-type domain-containing protein n=1 Tax=Rhizobium indigoferae TaxID=158891 RepID=A0ABZ0ZAM0_9HYPH|nr:hypothetical protein [Rhizobium indigoferae]WQN36636.1 hypothetical protein U5G49_001725 [Rhizobium indigoferae]
MADRFTPISIDDLITHDQVLEQYPFLSAQILNRWLREETIRCFKGKDGRTVYPKSDLSAALDKEMTCGRTEDSEASSNIATSGLGKSPVDQASIATGTRTEADVLREKLSMQSIFGKQKTNSSSSLGARRNQAKRQATSVSPTS